MKLATLILELENLIVEKTVVFRLEFVNPEQAETAYHYLEPNYDFFSVTRNESTVWVHTGNQINTKFDNGLVLDLFAVNDMFDKAEIINKLLEEDGFTMKVKFPKYNPF